MDYRPHIRHAPAMQHLVHIWLAVWTSNHIDPTPVNPMYFKNWDIHLPTSTTSATHIDHLAASLWLQPTSATHIEHLAVSLQPRPTSATRIEHLAASLRLRSYQLPTSTIQLTTPTTIHEFTSSFVNSTNKLSSLLYCYLTFVSFIVLFGCHYSHT